METLKKELYIALVQYKNEDEDEDEEDEIINK